MEKCSIIVSRGCCVIYMKRKTDTKCLAGNFSRSND